MRLLPLLLVLLLGPALCGQVATEPTPAQLVTLNAYQDTLASISERMHTDTSAKARFTSCKALIQTLVSALKTPNSFNYAFADVRGLVVRYSPDRTFRTITWELYVNSEEYRHYGALQRNASALELTPLVDRGDALRENPENVLTGADNWLGYVIYNILPVNTFQGKPYYILFGFDRYGRYRRQKIIDVLTYDAAGKLQFGAPIFDTYSDEEIPYEDRKRIILNYGAEASVALQYEAANKRIVYEHLVLSPGGEAGPINMPDGSYRAISPDDRGIWREIDRVYDHKYEEAPREAAKPADGAGLFGEQRGNGGGR